MDKKIKIFMKYPPGFQDSPYYKYLLRSLPKEISFVNLSQKNTLGATTSSFKLKFFNFFKYKIRDIIRFFRLPFSNIWYARTKKNFDLIHGAHCMISNKSPWVMDIEAPFQFWISGTPTFIGKKIVRRILMKSHCKKIMPWSNKTRKEIISLFPELDKKTEVVYPAIEVPKMKNEKHKEINILFVGRYFLPKGGLHSLEVMDRLTKKYENVRGIIVSKIPEEIKKNYKQNKKLIFYDLMPQEKLFEIYSISDIFLYPGYSDSFGFAFLEAMAFGIPIITLEGYAREEIVENNQDGFILPNKIVNFKQLDESENEILLLMEKFCERLIKDNNLRVKMSNNARKKIKSGKFSIKKRNKKLIKIYKEALK